MAKSSAFTLPFGLDMQVDDGGLSIRFDGDVVLEQTLGATLRRVEASGDVTLRLPMVTGDVVCGGTLTIEGPVQAGRLQARHIRLGNAAVTARAVAASESIRIGPAQVQVDVILAPEIRIDPAARGRVTVIESRNEREPTRIRGGFSYAEYDELFNNARQFLAERGVEPLGSAAASAPSATFPEDDELHTTEAPLTVERAVVTPDPASDEDADDPVSIAAEDLEPLMEEEARPAPPVVATARVEPAPPTDDLYVKLSDAVGRIQACYDGKEIPPAVAELRAYVEARDYTGLRRSITEVWNGLLTFHQKRGIRPHHQVTHAFNVIHGLMQA
jgi:hypothetical protein